MLLRLLVLFTLVPLVELYLLIRLGEQIGVGATVAIVIGTGVLGAGLTRLQGLRVLRELRERIEAGQLPTDALIDGLLILIAGAVLLTPGLITDACGFLLLTPQVRATVRHAIVRTLRSRIAGDGPVVLDARWRREED
jgi:UPF0716 protein FxsA